HGNLGFLVDNSGKLFDFQLQRVERFAHGVNDFNQLEFGIGVEVPLDWVRPFLEWNLSIPVGSNDALDCASSIVPCPGDAGFGSFPDVLTLGVQSAPIPELVLSLGADIGLTSAEALGVAAPAPYDILFGLAYVVDTVEPEPVIVESTDTVGPLGWLYVAVVEDGTDRPVTGAVVTYTTPANDLSAQLSSRENGRFRSYEFAVGTQVAGSISHPDYEDRTFDTLIEEPGERRVLIRMTAANIGRLIGTVTSAGGDPLPATVFVTGAEDSQAEVDPVTGEFNVEVERGVYTVTFYADGYVSRREQIELNGPVEREVSLSEAEPGQAAVMMGDRIGLSGERIRFENEDELSASSQELLDQVAALMSDYPELDFNIVAHTDDTGSFEVTGRQAQVVLEYLESAGVEPGRLTAEGAGAERPLVPNISNRNRERNRRVEFLIR
ncbi:MAG: OmpA family protein, partial [Myxococcales bacterium]|nr:OmpA family protein [Myxococcales bacterium]